MYTVFYFSFLYIYSAKIIEHLMWPHGYDYLVYLSSIRVLFDKECFDKIQVSTGIILHINSLNL